MIFLFLYLGTDSVPAQMLLCVCFVVVFSKYVEAKTKQLDNNKIRYLTKLFSGDLRVVFSVVVYF